ncbi:FAD-dependent oxidoreductase [uncultured Aquabacterium sp.]|uniref:NAD(P)/FAD-dependent oxidoreductase n=1 Tax=uncultured Aquabacterium sp. TaxID=158753 RepID=UPI0030D0372D
MTSISCVAVVGAGLAGLSCAQALRSAGLQVTVLDKSRGVAGRMSTRRGEGWQADHGAQYFTARHPTFAAEVARWTDAGVAAPWTPRIAVLGGDDPQRDGRGSLGGGASGDGGDGGLVRHVGVPRMTSPAQWLAEGLGVRTGHTVQTVQRDGAQWRLSTAEHGWLPEAFDALVLAMPAPQAEALLRQGWQGSDGTGVDAGAQVQAQAQAQVLADVAAAVAMRGCWALMLRFDAPVDLPFDAAFVNAGPLRWMARDSHKPGRPACASVSASASASAAAGETWVLHASAAWSEAHIEDSPEAVAEALLAAFAGWGGPTPAAWTAHRWRHADSLPPPPGLRHWLPELGLGLCGDWLAAGKVEGAWLSGHGLAMQVLGRQV